MIKASGKPDKNYGQLRWAKSPATKKSPQFISHCLHGLLVGFRTIHA